MTIIGHDKQWRFLNNAFTGSRISHAYLFSGSEGIGKKTVALEFAKLINCQNIEIKKKPCEFCSSCVSFSRGVHPDIIIMERLFGQKEIQIDEIRDLIYKLSFKPFLSSHKVAIIDQAHLMNQEAQNCFLKTLEEPKGKTILILITQYPERLFSTIRSRTQEIKFYSLSKKEMKDFLLKEGQDMDKISMLINFSLNSPGLAKKFINNQKKLKDYEQKINDLIRIFNDDLKERFRYAESLSKEDYQEVLNIWLRYLRELMLYKAGGIKKMSFQGLEHYSLGETKRLIYELEKIIFLMANKNVNKRLALEALMLQF